jgi:uncharacterized protein YndB with AHSA1/START domain
MSAKVRKQLTEKDREIVISRVLQAPREMVWLAMVDPQQMCNWWGPRGFTTTVHEMDLRPGGIWRLTMHGPDGTDYPNRCIFQEVVKPERIAYTLVGGKNGGTDVGFDATWTFESVDEKTTRLTICMAFVSASDRDRVAQEYGVIEGGKQTLERLEEHLICVKSEMFRSIVITRMYAAPPSVVFKAWTDPIELAQWWGPKGFTNSVCEIDPRVGGRWRIVMRAPDGAEYPCGGVYREIVEPNRLVFTNVAVDKNGQAIINGLTTVEFEEVGGGTKLTLRTAGTALVQYAAAYLKGMDAGWSQSLDRLAEQLLKM